jgi:hypothetical protein
MLLNCRDGGVIWLCGGSGLMLGWYCLWASSDSCLCSYWRRMLTVYCNSVSLTHSLLMCCLWASARWAIAYLLMMDSCSCISLSISCCTMISSSSYTAALSSSASSSQYCTSTWSSSCDGEGALGGDWCRAPSRVWVELTPQLLWLEPATVDMFARCWVARVLSKVGCSEVSVIVGRTWVGDWWEMFWPVVWSRPSFGWRRWLARLGGIARVIFGLKPQWTPNVGAK